MSLKEQIPTKLRSGLYHESQKSNFLQIIPSEVVFRDIEVNQYYEITVQIRNLTNKAKRIRFKETQNPNFKVQYTRQPEIAPGLSTTAKIKYECKELKNQIEFVKVISEDGNIAELPVRVYKMESQILFQPFINMGILKMGKEHTEVILIKNSGKALGMLQISHSHGPTLSVEPTVIKIAPKEQAKITVKYKPIEAGIFKGRIELKSQSILVKDVIDLHATSVDSSRFIVDENGNQFTSLDFGVLFVGQECIKKNYIVNNSPKVMKFKSMFRKGYLVSAQEFSLLQTPSEIGIEQSERVIFMEPQIGQIKPFTQLQIKLICRTKPSYKDKIFVKSYALASADQQAAINYKKSSTDFRAQVLHQYSFLLSSEDQEPIIIQLRANAICPQVKISQEVLQFGDCIVGQSLQQTLKVQNKNSFSKTEISFQKIPNYSIIPQKQIIKPNQQYIFRVLFEPKTIGKVDSVQKLFISNIYDFDLRLFGIAKTSDNRKKIKELEGTTDMAGRRVKAFSVADRRSLNDTKKQTLEQGQMRLDLSKMIENQDKFNKLLVDRRTDRLSRQQEEKVQKKWSLYQAKLKDLGLDTKLREKLDEEGIPTNAPIDYQFQSGMNDTKIRQQHIPMPPVKEKLFVTKHIKDYEPLIATSSNVDSFKKNVDEAPKRIFPQAPSNYNHRREICSELTPQELSQIQVPSNIINFGDVYIKSKESKYFWIRNSTKKAIAVTIKIAAPELVHSYGKTQIVQSGSEAAFQIVFCKDLLGDFKTSMKYLINSQHQFEMTITARCVLVNIDVNHTNLKFQFDEKSVEMNTTEDLLLHNAGNSDAFFKFILGKDKIFIPKILEGTIKSKQKFKVPIQLKLPMPTQRKNEYNYTERIMMKVLDGIESTIMCTYSIADPKFTVKAENLLKITEICLKHEINDMLEVRNTSKSILVVHIEGKGGLQIQEKVKINSQELKKFPVRFEAKQVGEKELSIVLTPRGGQKKIITTKIRVIEPKIKFSTEQINLGVLVVHGISGQGEFSLSNQNGIQIPLLLDLRPNRIKSDNPPFIEYLSIKLTESEQKLEAVDPPKKNQYDNEITENLVGKEVDEDDLAYITESDDEKIVDKNQDQFQCFRLIMKPKEIYKLKVEFHPKNVGKYSVTIPFSIENSIKIDNGPSIVCQGIKPQFVFEPSIIDFKRKIVTKPDRCYPKFIPVTVSNIGDEQVVWELKDDQIRKESIFNIQVNGGRLKPGEKLQMRVSFNPYTVSEFEYRLPLYITSNQIQEPMKYVDVVLKGCASLPNLFFNKREVILPVVPLDIETVSNFKIINDGYQNCNLKCQFLDDVANINVQITFPEGNNIGITRQKLRVDLAWKFSKPMSFCLKLQFMDDMNRIFTIPVSGTTDNCIFTNYTYFLRNENKFIIKADSALTLIQSSQNTAIVRKGSAQSLKSNATGKSVMSYLGLAPISASILAETIDYINRYLNSNLLTTPIDSFPGSLIQKDGTQIFEILSFISSKTTNYPWRVTGNQKGISRTMKLYEQYSELIRLLKVEGAHLNHIRPEYLLSFVELNNYLGSLPEEKTKSWLPSLLKINTGLFNYLSIEAWITLLYQMFKIYVLARVTAKNYKSHLIGAAQIPKIYLQTSNFSSTSQTLLFFWVEQAIYEVLLQQRRLKNFDKDFKDGIAIAALLQKYTNRSTMKRMKMVCSTEEEYRDNAHILCDGLQEIGMLNHITPRDIYKPLQRQMLLFILHLYVYLPFYTPKQQPILFKCILGEEVIRTIQLNNPSNKAVNYQVKYEGSDDFKMLGQSKFRLEPKQTYKFQVKFISRVSSTVKGRVMFINIKEKSLTAAALVFEVRSEIIGRISDMIWNISGVLYEQIQFPIEVQNKFSQSQMVDFQINFQTEYIFQTKTKNKQIQLPKEQQIQTIYGKSDTIKIRKNGSATLTLNFIPTSFFSTKTIIYFVNPIIGEFQHEILATVQPPALTAQIRPPMTLHVDQIVNWEYQLNPKNDMVFRARKVIEAFKKSRKAPKDTKDTKKQEIQAIQEEFIVQVTPNPYVTSKELFIISEKDNKSEKKKTQDNLSHENKLPFVFVCKNPVYEFSVYVLLFNKLKTDVRRYKVVFTIQPKPLKAILEMNVAARAEVTQNLPIVNNTQRDWTVKIQWQPDNSKNGNYFHIPPQYMTSFPVKRNTIGNFPITFKPKWVHQAEAKLIMSNPLTLDQFEYQIIGNGEQPLAEEHIQIKCQAKQLVKQEIYVKNPYSDRPINLQVEADILNCHAPEKLTISSGGKQKYTFTVQPMLCGEYTGSITFVEEEGSQYIWYTVSIITNYPQAYKQIELEAEIRTAVKKILYLPYDLDKSNTYEVILNGLGLSGQPIASLVPNVQNNYILQYLPLQVGQQRGSVCFINSQIGQLLYNINLKCTEKPPIVIKNIKSPLGVSTIIEAELQNPLPTKTSVSVDNSNPEQFVVRNNVIKLEPHEKKVIEIQYIPASLDNIETATIVFSSKDVGEWVYQLSGSGKAPIPFAPYTIFNGLFQENSSSVRFKNPFKYSIIVGIKLLIQESNLQQIFKLLNHGKSRFEIDSFGFLQIPFSFIPTSCRMYECKIQVMISQKIFWIFPIIGITEVNEGKCIANLVSQSRLSTSQYVQIQLPGVESVSSKDIYDWKFENIPNIYAPLIEKFLIIESPKNYLNHSQDSLQFHFHFKPMKPIKVMFDFVISKPGGARWRHQVTVESTDPQPDDIIEIQSNLIVTSTVSFKMTNSAKSTASFKAKFTSDSAHEFSVDPKEGTLSKFGGKGTTFLVSFTPVEYGKEKKGKLVIQTDEMYWSYLLKGSLPKYVPPKIQGSRLRIASERKS